MFLLVDYILKISSFVIIVSASTNKGPDARCFHYLSARNGVIRTPNYPDAYPASLTCVWTITVNSAYYVELTFHDFDIEAYDQCKADVLEVKDGGTQNAPLIGGQYCNVNKPPKVLTSSNNQLRLWFLSDQTKHYKGFNASYRAVKDEACGGLIYSTHGKISTPRYPLPYPRNRKCEWIFEAPKNEYIVIEFDSFELETACPLDKACMCLDKLVVEDGDISKSYCMAKPPKIISKENKLKLTFTSDIYGRLRGFEASFTYSSTPDCGKNIYDDSGIIESPDFNEDPRFHYQPYTHCIWRINTSISKYISLKVLFMDIPPNEYGKCFNDFLEIRDGFDEAGPLIGYFCNSFYSNITISTGNQLYLSFRTDGKINGRGFRIEFNSHSKDCQSSLGMEDGRIHDYQLYSSSMLKHSYHPKFARLNGEKAWCSQMRADGIEGEYIAVYFKQPMYFTKIVTQGFEMDGEAYYVTSYSLEYEKDDDYTVTYNKRRHGYQKTYSVLIGNSNAQTSVENILDPPITSQRLRIIPLTYKSNSLKTVCLRFELFGCYAKDAP